MQLDWRPHLHAPSFLYSPNQRLLLERMLRGHRADDHVHLPHGFQQARVIVQRPLSHTDEIGTSVRRNGGFRTGSSSKHSGSRALTLRIVAPAAASGLRGAESGRAK